MSHTLAQANAALTRHPFDHPELADLSRQIEAINALAMDSPGFIQHVIPQRETDLERVGQWLNSKTTARIFFNMSVWDSIESLRKFTYHTQHRELIGRKKDWLVPSCNASYVLWWIPRNTVPTVTDACQRLQEISARGPSSVAFDLKTTFPPTA